MNHYVMLVANSKELRKALKSQQSEIYIGDDKFKTKIIKAAKISRRLNTAESDLIKGERYFGIDPPTFNMIAPTTIIVLSLIAMTTIISVIALFREYNVKVVITKDGAVEIIADKG